MKPDRRRFIASSLLTAGAFSFPVSSQDRTKPSGEARTVSLRGKVICLTEELQKLYQIIPDCETRGHVYTLKTAAGNLHPFLPVDTAAAVWMLVATPFASAGAGMAVGATAGAVSGALTDVGIDDKFMKQLADGLPPRSSALFVLVRRVTPDRVLEEVQGSGGKILKTSLTHEDETKLQAALSAAKK